MTVREPFAAGRFYPDDKSGLKDMIEKAGHETKTDISQFSDPLIGGISPHAGYIFSLTHMIPLFELFKRNITDRNHSVLLNPNHSGKGASLSIDSHSFWNTPLGAIKVDQELTNLLIEKSMNNLSIVKEPLAQKYEHSAEVIVPLMQYYLGEINFLPLCMGVGSFVTAQNLAKLFYDIFLETGIKPMIIASSDFNHFNTPKRGRELDDYALEPLMEFDSMEFLKRIHDKHISICGYGPIVVLLEFAKLISNNPSISILSRGHSGESEYYKGREPVDVVDYISLAVFGDIKKDSRE